jgi:hypothetical protein
MYVIKHKQIILFLNNLFGKTYWRFGNHVLLNTCWQSGVLLSLSVYVYDPTYIGPQYNKKTYMVVIMYCLVIWRSLLLSVYVYDPI